MDNKNQWALDLGYQANIYRPQVWVYQDPGEEAVYYRSDVEVAPDHPLKGVDSALRLGTAYVIHDEFIAGEFGMSGSVYKPHDDLPLTLKYVEAHAGFGFDLLPNSNRFQSDVMGTFGWGGSFHDFEGKDGSLHSEMNGLWSVGAKTYFGVKTAPEKNSSQTIGGTLIYENLGYGNNFLSASVTSRF